MDSSGLSTKASTETHMESTTAPSISNDPMYVVTPQNDSKITTSEVNQMTTINATTLVEILNSVVAAANMETQSNEGRMSSQSLQFQLQLTPQTTAVDATENGVGEAKGKGRQSGTKGKGKEKQPWHYHLGGVRHSRVPLSPDIKEALEVAYISRIMSKNFRKEGQPEKERIARITGLELDKVHEWFKNRRKKDKLLQSRTHGINVPRGKRGRKPILPHLVVSPTTSTPNTKSINTEFPQVTTDSTTSTQQ